MERAIQLSGDLPLSVALMLRSAVAAYRGRVNDARADATEAIAASRRCGSTLLAEWPTTILGSLDVSVGDHRAALEALEPLLATLDPPPKGTEIFVATFVPDAVEAMVHTGRFADAEPLIDMLERNGRRVDRPWMLAIGARCRSLLLAAQGDIVGALLAAERAITEHDRLPMPFVRARTQLLLGQLQRKKRRNDLATATLREALTAFERIDVPLWAERVRTELGRTDITSGRGALLTPSEQRVAELAATGMTNLEVAAQLFISPKTVEANLSRIYRKLGIQSRAELGGRMTVS